MEIGFNYLAADPLIAAASPYLSQLARDSGETANLTEPVGSEMVYVAQLMTSKYIPVLTPVGMRIPMYCTSSGRAYLSTLPDAEAITLLERSQRVARTPATLTEVQAILARVQSCRQFGFAVNEEELFLGDMGLAAPIVDRQGMAVGAVHVSPPASRWTMAEAQRKLAPLVIECARAISLSLGALRRAGCPQDKAKRPANRRPTSVAHGRRQRAGQLHRACSSIACNSTSAPAAMCSGMASSSSLWLMPSLQGTKIMPVGARCAT